MDKNYDVITFQKTFVLRRAGVANFADIIKIATMFIKTIFKNWRKLADYRWKNADVSRTQGVCQMIHISFGSSLGKI